MCYSLPYARYCVGISVAVSRSRRRIPLLVAVYPDMLPHRDFDPQLPRCRLLHEATASRLLGPFIARFGDALNRNRDVA